MNTTVIVGILGGIVLVGFFAYNIYDSFLKKDDDTSDDNSTKA